jgi:hypothetical protein
MQGAPIVIEEDKKERIIRVPLITRKEKVAI